MQQRSSSTEVEVEGFFLQHIQHSPLIEALVVELGPHGSATFQPPESQRSLNLIGFTSNAERYHAKAGTQAACPGRSDHCRDYELTTPTDQEICNELMTIQGKLEILRSQMTATEKALIRCRLGTIRILPIHDEMREKLDDQKRQFDTDIGELTLLGSCPVNCLYHMEFDPLNTSKILNDEAQKDLAIFEKQLKSEIAAKNKPQPPKEIKDKTPKL
ncbi:hypothetical protein TNIN_77271 [Trichonephila inaurata madagascariensis]|uniref:Uncharacterized protein n=1 Tax=Trichonephila inaurata madagascariensis TaxID=2747483 RepID=A0A8X6YTT8_9ARAC|nr:hypothetical protein TNIN_77271 [Trichonephila inaurata madagascariensis]